MLGVIPRSIMNGCPQIPMGFSGGQTRGEAVPSLDEHIATLEMRTPLDRHDVEGGVVVVVLVEAEVFPLRWPSCSRGNEASSGCGRDLLRPEDVSG